MPPKRISKATRAEAAQILRSVAELLPKAPPSLRGYVHGLADALEQSKR